MDVTQSEPGKTTDTTNETANSTNNETTEESTPSTGSHQRIKKRKVRARLSSMSDAELCVIDQKRRKRRVHIMNNARMNAWKLACAHGKLFRKSEFEQVPGKGTPEHELLKAAQYNILDDVWKTACKNADSDLIWVTAENIDAVGSTKAIDLTPEQLKLKDVMQTDAYKDIHEVCKVKLRQDMIDHTENSSKCSRQAWDTATVGCNAPEMKDIPRRGTGKFKRLAADAKWRTKYDEVYAKYKELVNIELSA